MSEPRWLKLAIACLLGTATLLALIIWWAASLPLNLTDRLTMIGIAIAAATFVLAVLAAIVAIAAYKVAIRVPELAPEIEFFYCKPNEPVLAIDEADSSRGIPFRQTRSTKEGMLNMRQLEAQVRVRNLTPYSARNPAVKLSLFGMAGLSPAYGSGWIPVPGAQVTGVGVNAVQWEGGADYAIHGNWTRVLPPLDFSGVRIIGQPVIGLDVVAEGFRKVTHVPVKTVALEDWDALRASGQLLSRR